VVDRTVIAGNFSMVNGQSRDRIAQINEDGTMDLAYGVSASSTVVLAMGINTNPAMPLLIGKSVVGGNFTVLNGNNANRVARLNVDGSADLTFNTGSGANGTVSALATSDISFTATSSSASLSLWYGATDNFTVSVLKGGVESAKSTKGSRARSSTVSGATVTINKFGRVLKRQSDLPQFNPGLGELTIPFPEKEVKIGTR